MSLTSAPSPAAPGPDVDSQIADIAPEPSRIADIARILGPHPVALGHPIEERTPWEKAAQSPVGTEILKAAEAELLQPTGDLPDELYLIYSRTGSRDEYQDAASAITRRYATLALAECLENRGRFLPALEAQLREVCGRRTWVMPAHDPKLDNLEGRTMRPDLNATMTSWDLAVLDYWLGAKFTPALREHLRTEMRRRVLEPYREVVTSRMTPAELRESKWWWIHADMNWNAVCTGGTLATALAIIDDPAERAFYLAAAEKNLEHFLEGFGPDGYCSEGLSYWSYGFGHYSMAAETVRLATGGQMNWFTKPQVKLVGKYARRLQIGQGGYPAFADCRVGDQPANYLLLLLNRQLPGGSGLPAIPDQGQRKNHLYITAISLFDTDTKEAATLPAGPPAFPPRDFFEQAGVLVVRPGAAVENGLAAALKGGHNGEMHNHNDVGSFVVQVGATQLLIDPGKETYTSRTFGPHRYESTMMNSLGHSVPRIAGQLQRTGRDAYGKILAAEFTPERDVYALDLRACYAQVEDLEAITREFVYLREGRGKLVIVDRVKFKRPADFGTALVTFSPWRPSGEDELIVGEDGAARALVKIVAEGGELAPVKAEQLPDGKKPTRLGLDFAAPVREGTIRVEISPLPAP